MSDSQVISTPRPATPRRARHGAVAVIAQYILELAQPPARVPCPA